LVGNTHTHTHTYIYKFYSISQGINLASHYIDYEGCSKNAPSALTI